MKTAKLLRLHELLTEFDDTLLDWPPDNALRMCITAVNNEVVARSEKHTRPNGEPITPPADDP